MALTKEVKCDKIEIVGDYKAVQCRQATVISEDGVELSRSFNRHVLIPIQIFQANLKRFRISAMQSGRMK